MSESKPSPEPKPEHRHETSDARIGPILWFGLGLGVVALVLHGLVAWMLAGFADYKQQSEPPLPPIAEQRSQFPKDLNKIPEPRLQESEVGDMQAMRQKEDAILNSYGMIDAKNQVVRIPIARAMELLASKETEREKP
jgi:hypothetical protein